jgi:hypothetical protein
VSVAAFTVLAMSESDSNARVASSGTIGATSGSGPLERDPTEWVSGDDPITEAQRSYLDTLAKQAGEEHPAEMTKAEASQHIERLKGQLGR